MGRHRSSRRRLRALACGSLAAGTGVMVLAAAQPVSARPPAAVEVTYTADGMPPVFCEPRPDQEGPLQVVVGERVNLINLTGVEAVLSFGDGERTLASGQGLSVHFRPGNHLVRMVPACALSREAVVLVQVLLPGAFASTPAPEGGGSEPAPSSPDPSGSPTPITSPDPSASSVPNPGQTGSPAPSEAPATGSSASGSPTSSADAGSSVPLPSDSPGGAATPPALPAGTEPGAARSAATDARGLVPYPRPPFAPGGGAGDGRVDGAVDSADAGPYDTFDAGADETATYDVYAFTVDGLRDHRGTGLLAVVAIICVLGVSTAIIRAILTQRSRSVICTK